MNDLYTSIKSITKGKSNSDKYKIEITNQKHIIYILVEERIKYEN